MYIKPFRWYGGKYRVISHILALIPNDITMWFEVCCGSAAVTLNKHIHPHEVINDLDNELVNFFSILTDRREGANLIDKLMCLYRSPIEFVLAKRARENTYRGLDDMTKAVMTFILITQSFNACRMNYQKGVRQLDYRIDIQYHLPLIYERLKNVIVTQYDATYIVDKMRNIPNAFILADLPYLHQLRAAGACNVYGKEMTFREHMCFLETARNAKCAIMICGYRREDGNDLYDHMLLGHGNWRHYLLAELPKSCKTTKSKGIGREWIWINYDLPGHAKYYISLDSAN